MIESMIFFPETTLYEKPQDYGLVYEEVTITVEKDLALHGWYLPALGTGTWSARFRSKPGTPGTGPVVLFFHGNAGNIANRLYKAQGWIERNFSVLLVDYRGYGKSEGKIKHQNDVIADAEASYQWLIQEKKSRASDIILYGESLGSFPAVRLGTRYPVAAVILEAPFTSLFEVARKHYPFVFKQMMANFEFSNIDAIAELQAPLFILHGTQDEICPYTMAGDLFEKAPEPKGFLSIPNGMHNDLPIKAGSDYWDKALEFIAKNARPLR